MISSALESPQAGVPSPRGTRLPDILLAGVSKAGTTSLYYHLAKHPEISIGDKKELHLLQNGVCGREEYGNHFRHTYAGEKHILEASPGYFDYGETLARRVREYLGPIKVIVMLREPCSLLISYYLYRRQNQKLGDQTIEQFFEERVRMRHHTWARLFTEWHGVFGDSLRVVFLEDLLQHTLTTVDALCRWLGIDPAPLTSIPLRNENSSFTPRSGTVQKYFYGLVGALRQRNLYVPPAVRGAARSLYRTLNAGGGSRIAREKRHLQDRMHSLVHCYMAPELGKLAAVLYASNQSIPAWLEAYR